MEKAPSQLQLKPDPQYRLFWTEFQNLSALDQKQILRHQGLNDLYFLAKYILDFWWLCDKPHIEFARKIQEDRHLSLYLLPRGNCKTQIFSIADSIRHILRDPLNPIGLGSDSSKRAKKRLRTIKFHFEKNGLLRELYSDKIWDNPDRQSPKWTDEELILPGHDGRMEASITAFGINSMPTGSHFPRIKFDDVVTPENTNTPELILQTIEDYGMVRSSILQQAGGNVQVCGTIYDDADLHCEMERSGEYAVYKRSAAVDPHTGKTTTDFKNAILLWPEQFSAEVLDGILRDPAVTNYIFSCQYLLDPVPDDEHAFFNLRLFPEYEGYPPIVAKYAGMDFAISEEEQANYSAIVVIGVGLDNHIYVLHVRRGKWDSLQIIDNMIDVQAIYRPAVFVSERGKIEKAIEPFLKIKMQETGVVLNIEKKTAIQDKVTRARPIQGRCKQGMVHLPKRGPDQPEWLNAFRHELRRFPRGKDKDQVDAFAWLGQHLEQIHANEWDGVAV